MFDDAGFGQPSTFGGEIETPTLSRLAEEGISYNASTPRPCARRPGPR
jgi:arylsulfatase A-like enzyme